MEAVRNVTSPEALEVLTSIRRIVRAVSLHSRDLGRSSGLTVPQLLALRAVQAAGHHGTTATEILDDVGVTAGTLSGIIQRLVHAGLIDRRRSDQDRRRVVLTLSARGRSTLQEAPRPLQARFVERLESLPIAEREQIIASLHRVVQMMEAEAIDASPILTEERSLSRIG